MRLNLSHETRIDQLLLRSASPLNSNAERTVRRPAFSAFATVWADFLHASMLGRRLCTRMRQEEADHLPTGVGAARVSVGATGAPAGPSMARAVKDPLLKDLLAAGVELDRAGIGHAARRLAMRHHLGQRRLL